MFQRCSWCRALFRKIVYHRILSCGKEGLRTEVSLEIMTPAFYGTFLVGNKVRPQKTFWIS